MKTSCTQKPVLALLNCGPQEQAFFRCCSLGEVELLYFASGFEFAAGFKKHRWPVAAVVSQCEVLSMNGVSLKETLLGKYWLDVPFCIIPKEKITDTLKHLAHKAGVAELFSSPLDRTQVETRLNFLMANWKHMHSRQARREFSRYKTRPVKRMFDIAVSGLLLLCLLPVFLIVYLWIKLESPGPAFYYSPRVGTGYRIFKFYKFRSMYTDADKRLKELQHLNQYAAGSSSPCAAGPEDNRCISCVDSGFSCQYPMYADKEQWCERAFLGSRNHRAGSAFFKLKDDPRITRIGKFIRNTSIDELPQLWNVFTGDMSIVGNRPLPLYEAEKLTTDKYACGKKRQGGDERGRAPEARQYLCPPP